MPSKSFHRFPMRRHRGSSFTHNHDRHFQSADQQNYGSDSFHEDYTDHYDDDYRSSNSASPHGSIASTTPSERHDETPDTIVAESSSLIQKTRESAEGYRESARSPARSASQSPCPPGLPSLSNKSTEPVENAASPSKIGGKGDITSGDEVNNFFSQSKYNYYKFISFRNGLQQIRSKLILTRMIEVTWKTVNQTVMTFIAVSIMPSLMTYRGI
jgi:hypothetical protein